MSDKPPKDPREQVQRRADDAIRKGIEALEIAIDSEKWKACPHCKKRVFLADTRAITEALKFFMDYGYGKPETRKAPVEKEVKTKNLEDLSMDELLSIIGEEDGETDGGAAEEAAQ